MSILINEMKEVQNQSFVSCDLSALEDFDQSSEVLSYQKCNVDNDKMECNVYMTDLKNNPELGILCKKVNIANLSISQINEINKTNHEEISKMIQRDLEISNEKDKNRTLTKIQLTDEDKPPASTGKCKTLWQMIYGPNAPEVPKQEQEQNFSLQQINEINEMIKEFAKNHLSEVPEVPKYRTVKELALSKEFRNSLPRERYKMLSQMDTK